MNSSFLNEVPINSENGHWPMEIVHWTCTKKKRNQKGNNNTVLLQNVIDRFEKLISSHAFKKFELMATSLSNAPTFALQNYL